MIVASSNHSLTFDFVLSYNIVQPQMFSPYPNSHKHRSAILVHNLQQQMIAHTLIEDLVQVSQLGMETEMVMMHFLER